VHGDGTAARAQLLVRGPGQRHLKGDGRRLDAALQPVQERGLRRCRHVELQAEAIFALVVDQLRQDVAGRIDAHGLGEDRAAGNAERRELAA
jgi:hypothetical protein